MSIVDFSDFEEPHMNRSHSKLAF